MHAHAAMSAVGREGILTRMPSYVPEPAPEM